MERRKLTEEARKKRAASHKAWWERNKGRYQKYQKEWRAKHPEQTRETKRRYAESASGAYSTLKKGAARRGKASLDITRDEFVRWLEESPQVCYYCKRPVKRGIGMSKRTIDRKDCKKGYCLSNIVIACSRCNMMKGNWLTAEQMLDAAMRYFSS